jgi:hypothetical protein
MEAGPFSGRLILGSHVFGDYLPCTDHPHFRDCPRSSSIIYSDDDGDSWRFGGIIGDDTAFKHGEASATPVNGGRQILLARRNSDPASPGKTMHLSDDGGETWNDGFVTNVATNICLQVLETCGDTVLCSTPANRERTHGRIYVSRDHGRSWTYKCIDEGLFSYSTVNRLTDEYFMCCFSLRGHGSMGLAARIFSADWLKPAGQGGTP